MTQHIDRALGGHEEQSDSERAAFAQLCKNVNGTYLPTAYYDTGGLIHYQHERTRLVWDFFKAGIEYARSNLSPAVDGDVEHAYREGVADGLAWHSSIYSMHADEEKAMVDAAWNESEAKTALTQQPANGWRETSERLTEALIGLRYSHGCWCDRPVEGGELHSRSCVAASKALPPSSQGEPK